MRRMDFAISVCVFLFGFSQHVGMDAPTTMRLLFCTASTATSCTISTLAYNQATLSAIHRSQSEMPMHQDTRITTLRGVTH